MNKSMIVRIFAVLLTFSGTMLLTPAANAMATDTVPLTRCCSDDATYKAFGERDGIYKLMNDFMRELLADDRTRPFFEHVDQQRVILMLTDQVCYATGGPCEYKGRSMADAHHGMGVKREHFNALVEDLQTSMTRFKIPFRDQNKLLAVFAPMYRDVEQPKAVD